MAIYTFKIIDCFGQSPRNDDMWHIVNICNGSVGDSSLRDLPLASRGNPDLPSLRGSVSGANTTKQSIHFVIAIIVEHFKTIQTFRYCEGES